MGVGLEAEYEYEEGVEPGTGIGWGRGLRREWVGDEGERERTGEVVLQFGGVWY